MSRAPFGDGDTPHIPLAMKNKFMKNVVRVDDVHQTWDGPISSRSGTPFMYFEEKQVHAAVIAFIMRTGRWPVGYVRRMCDVQKCVGFRCVEDHRGRARLDEQLVALGLRKRRRYRSP